MANPKDTTLIFIGLNNPPIMSSERWRREETIGPCPCPGGDIPGV